MPLPQDALQHMFPKGRRLPQLQLLRIAPRRGACRGARHPTPHALQGDGKGMCCHHSCVSCTEGPADPAAADVTRQSSVFGKGSRVVGRRVWLLVQPVLVGIALRSALLLRPCGVGCYCEKWFGFIVITDQGHYLFTAHGVHDRGRLHSMVLQEGCKHVSCASQVCRCFESITWRVCCHQLQSSYCTRHRRCCVGGTGHSSVLHLHMLFTHRQAVKLIIMMAPLPSCTYAVSPSLPLCIYDLHHCMVPGVS